MVILLSFKCYHEVHHTLSSIVIRMSSQEVCIHKVVRQLEADILTISRGNSILVLSCLFKVSKYISGWWPR